MPTTKHLTPRQTADRLGITTGTLLAYNRQGKLEPIRLNKRKFLYRQADVDRLLRGAQS